MQNAILVRFFVFLFIQTLSMKPFKLLIRAAFLILSLAFTSTITSCNDEEDDLPPYPEYAKQTVIMYMPWADSYIYTYFLKNISAFENAIEQNHGLGGNQLIVFISDNEQKSHMERIYYKDGECHRETLKTYDFASCDYTTPEGISQIINDAVAVAPASTYAMAIGCHGMGWIPVGTNIGTRTVTKNAPVMGAYPTRFFGSGNDPQYQTDITTLAKGVADTGIKMKYILFDDCYMSNIETAYDLRNVTDYLIASTCEIMIDGMPYDEIGIDLLNNNFKNVVDKFYNHYSDFRIPCGTIGVTDCREITEMASIMKQINTTCSDLPCDITAIQGLDGCENTIFFDFGDYVAHLCTNPTLLAAFEEQLDRLVIYKANTETYYTSLFYQDKEIPIHTFSGITISDPSVNRSIANVKKQTNWYRDTH